MGTTKDLKQVIDMNSGGRPQHSDDECHSMRKTTRGLPLLEMVEAETGQQIQEQVLGETSRQIPGHKE